MQFRQRSLAWRVGTSSVSAFRKKVYNRPPQEECLELAEACLMEAERTLDREVAEMSLLKAGCCLEDARRIMAWSEVPNDRHFCAGGVQVLR
jgi:hypothetical protein